MRLRLALTISAAVIGLATPAHAEPNADVKFITALNNAGITYKTSSDAIGIGKQACQFMDQGRSEADVIKAMTQENPGFTTALATKFTQIAENIYCPQHTGGAVAPPSPTQQPYSPPAFIPLPPPPAAA